LKVLVIGSGGREHALCWKISQSKIVDKIYCAPGNGGTKKIAENVSIKVNDIDTLLAFALNNNIDLTVVGPEEPLVLGIVDKFEANGLKIFGPNSRSSMLEGSKEFTKIFLEKYQIPTAKYNSYVDCKEAINGLAGFEYPLVIKADGLCFGKGVVICDNERKAKDTLKEIFEDKIFGDEGNKVVIEEFLDGIESSLLCFVTNGKIIPMESAKDYKKIYDNDLGPNTGGIGCYSPSPLYTDELKSRIKIDVLDKIAYGLEAEKFGFKGILFIGFMIADGIPKVLEFNVRFGDPETEVLIPRLESDIMDLFFKTIDGTLEDKDLRWKDESCLTVVLTSKGYPDSYDKGLEITGIGDLDDSILLFHNGTRYDGDKLLTNGGRVLSVTSLGEDLNKAHENIYNNIQKIHYDGVYYRKDIGIIKD